MQMFNCSFPRFFLFPVLQLVVCGGTRSKRMRIFATSVHSFLLASIYNEVKIAPIFYFPLSAQQSMKKVSIEISPYWFSCAHCLRVTLSRSMREDNTITSAIHGNFLCVLADEHSYLLDSISVLQSVNLAL